MRAQKAPVCGESSLRPRLRGSLADMLERYCRAAEGHHRWPRPFGSTTESRSSCPSAQPDVAVVQIERAARIDQQARLNRGQSRSAGNGYSRTRGTRAISMLSSPVIHAMPQIFSLSFTVRPRHYAARSRSREGTRRYSARNAGRFQPIDRRGRQST